MSGYIGNAPTPQATQTRDSFTATASQTSFATAGYTPQFLDVFLNGIHLLNPEDYTASNGSDVVLTAGAALDDVLEVISYSTYEVNSQNYTGGLTVDNSAATVLTVDRAGSDGSVIDVQRNGTTVGSIGVVSGSSPHLTLGSGDTGVLFNRDNDHIVPWNTSTNGSRDNAMDIGGNTDRFKDLYLSGGVYLGGTGAANKLDDYEEGTWTPSFSAGSFGTQYNFTYTKIGRVVHITGYVANLTGLPSSILSISGLPFAGNADYQMSLLWYNGTSSAIAAAYLPSGSTALSVRPIGGWPSSFTELSVQMTYITNT